MQINTAKTKPIFLGRFNAANFHRLSIPTGSVERVTSFKLIGINFQANVGLSISIQLPLKPVNISTFYKRAQLSLINPHDTKGGGTPSNINEIYTSMKSTFSGLQYSVADSTGLYPFVVAFQKRNITRNSEKI